MGIKLHLIGVIVDSNAKDILGIRILNSETMVASDVERTRIKYIGEEVDGIKLFDNEFNSTRGSIKNFPKIMNGQLHENGCLVVIKKTGSELIVSSWQGKTVRGEVSAAIGAMKKFGIANGKLVGNDVVSLGAEFISIAGEKVLKAEVNVNKEVGHKIVMKNASEVVSNLPMYIASRNGSNERLSKTIMCDVNGVQMSLEQKMAKANINLRKIAPFTQAMLSIVRIVENTSIKTAGVTLDTMYFNPNFFARLPLNELIFVYMHEMNHLLMQHRIREKSRVHTTWNKACDAYINALLGANFPEIFTCEQMKQSNYVVIDGLDLVTETPEKIYEQMMKEKAERKKEKSQGGGSGSGGSGEDEEDEDDGEDDGSNDSGYDYGDLDDSVDTYKGQILGGDDPENPGDLCDDGESSGMSDETKEQKSKAMVNKAKVFNDTMNNKRVGNGEGGMLREIEKALAPTVDWRSIVRQKLTLSTRVDSSFASPDRRFVSNNTILPGPRPLDPNMLADVYVCIDTSGSISNKDLGVFFKMFQELLTKFHCYGEIVYWGSNIEATYPYKDWKEAIKAKPVGGGGTDVNCVFEYFDGIDFKRGKKKKPKLIVIPTDGCFSAPKEKYRKWNKETIWLLSGTDLDRFKAAFGRVAPIKKD